MVSLRGTVGRDLISPLQDYDRMPGGGNIDDALCSSEASPYESSFPNFIK